jgi:outer membrane protein insertion porin family
MKAGEVANGVKFDKGLKEVQKAYGTHGYIQSRMNPTPEFDDAGSKVTFKIAVNEGPQYRMGAVEFKGFSADDAAALSKKWRLKSGDVYDQSYAANFIRDDAREIMARIVKERQSMGRPMPNLGTRETPGSQSLTVNLTVELKD